MYCHSEERRLSGAKQARRGICIQNFVRSLSPVPLGAAKTRLEPLSTLLRNSPLPRPRLSQAPQLRINFFYLRPGGVQRAGVVNHVVGGGNLLQVRPLRRLAALHFAARGFRIHSLAGGEALDLLLGAARYHHHLVEPAAHPGSPDERSLHDRHPCRAFTRHLRQPLLLPGDHRRMNQPVQLLHAAVAERKLRQPRTVNRPIGIDDLRTKMSHHVVVHRLAGLHEFVRDHIGLKKMGPQLDEHAAHDALTARYAAGQANAQQGCSYRLPASAGMREPRRIRAALTVLTMSMAIVSGPTPPGTGVSAPATSATLG